MIWLSKIRSGDAVGINPTEIKSVEVLEMYMSPRDTAPNRVPDPRTPEGDEPFAWYGTGAVVSLRGKGDESFSVEQTLDEVRTILINHED